MSQGSINEETWAALRELQRLCKGVAQLWESTKELTGNVRPVDAWLGPVGARVAGEAPAAARLRQIHIGLQRRWWVG